MKTFGRIIAEGRKALGISQKDLAAKTRKEDGQSISPQYLNDIEHDRRDPPGGFILDQLAKNLKLSKEYLTAAAGKWPADLHGKLARIRSQEDRGGLYGLPQGAQRQILRRVPSP